MTHLHPPATLYKKGNDYIVEAYTGPEPIEESYADEDSGGNRFLDTNSFNEDTHEWMQSKVTLTVHKDSQADIRMMCLINSNHNFDTDDEALTNGIDISSLLPRLEVRPVGLFGDLPGTFWMENQVFLKPEPITANIVKQAMDAVKHEIRPPKAVREGLVKPEQPVNEHCPTCGAEVKVVGDVTKHYEPVNEAEEDQESLIRELAAILGHGQILNSRVQEAQQLFTIKRK